MTTVIKQPKCAVADAKTITIDQAQDGSLFIGIDDTPMTIQSGYGYFDQPTAQKIIEAISREMNVFLPEAANFPKKAPNGLQAYRGNGKHLWEDVVEERDDCVAVVRLRVPGGWLYSTDLDEAPMTFVPTPAGVGYPI